MNRRFILFFLICLNFLTFFEISSEGGGTSKEPTALSKLSPEDREALFKYLKELVPQAQSGSKWLSLSSATITAFSTLGTSLTWACYYWKTNPIALTNLAITSLNAWICRQTSRDVKKVRQDLKKLRAEALSNQERLCANLNRFQQGNAKQHHNLSQQLIDLGQDSTKIKGKVARIETILECIQGDITTIKKNGVATEESIRGLQASVALLATQEDARRIEKKIDSLKQ